MKGRAVRHLFRAGMIWKGVWSFSLSILLVAQTAPTFEMNQDGKDLIQQASQAYTGDMRNRPIVTEPQIRDYVEKKPEPENDNLGY